MKKQIMKGILKSMKKFGPDIGGRLKEVRNIANVSSCSVANSSFVSPEHYRMIEYGEYYPNSNVLQYAHMHNWDIDYIIVGRRSYESVFEKYLGKNGLDNRMYRYQLINIEIKHIMDNISGDVTYVRWNTDNEKPIERLKYMLVDKGYDIDDKTVADVLGVSSRTVSRMCGDAESIKVDMVLSAYEKCGIYPSYFLYGDINSNSECDIQYNAMSDSQKVSILKYAEKISSV